MQIRHLRSVDDSLVKVVPERRSRTVRTMSAATGDLARRARFLWPGRRPRRSPDLERLTACDELSVARAGARPPSTTIAVPVT
jgi:hypothetical protein